MVGSTVFLYDLQFASMKMGDLSADIQMSAYNSPIIWAIHRPSNKYTVSPPSKITPCSARSLMLHYETHNKPQGLAF